MRVLVVDDVALMLDAVTALLRESCDVVGAVTNGRSALKKILELAPDVVVLDISMPGMNGIEVALEMKRQGSSTKVVFLTSHEDPEVQEICAAAGGLGYVLKDSLGTDLVAALGEAQAGRKFASVASPHKRNEPVKE
jgi:DNA-binding NarL/FixJ family response regulator